MPYNITYIKYLKINTFFFILAEFLHYSCLNYKINFYLICID